MAVLTNLKLISASRANSANPVAVRRSKLTTKLQEQLRLVEAKKAGQSYLATRIKTVADAVTGERKTVEVGKKLREWFWQNEAGKYILQVKYGSSVMYLNSKNATAIELGSIDELSNVLKSLQEAVQAGEFDKAMEVASQATRKAFGK
jgi:hypothetical protein